MRSFGDPFVEFEEVGASGTTTPCRAPKMLLGLLLSQLGHIAAPSPLGALSGRWPGLQGGVKGWADAVDCPCADRALCKPIAKARSREDVYAFHTTGNTSWQHYDWSQITTVCVFGAVDPQLLCKAHSAGARVTLGASGPPTGSWNDTNAVDAWVKAGVARVLAAKADGLNLDVEISSSDPQQLAGLTPAVKQMVDAMHGAQPGSHVTFDTPSEGETGTTQAKCGQMYGRDYPYKALAEILDFFVVMDYDSNDARDAAPSNGVQFLPHPAPKSGPYIYPTREAAAAACKKAGMPRLCKKEELKNDSRCAYGWCSDWSGLWLASAEKGCGSAGFNPVKGSHKGLAGAYCCGGSRKICPTCFYANDALPVVKNGVECYKSLGVPTSKLVLAFPWYGYDYTCNPTDTPGSACHVTGAVQTTLVKVKAQLATALSPGRIWQSNSSTPHFFYRDANSTLHRVDYDDSQSLRLKYNYAKSVGARGVGMWTASAIASDAQMVTQFWKDLKEFM